MAWIPSRFIAFLNHPKSAENGGAKDGRRVRRHGSVRGGENTVALSILPDSAALEDVVAANDLLLYGTLGSNIVLRRFEGRLSLEFEGNSVRLCGCTCADLNAAVFAALPHPGNSRRFAAVHGGITPDAFTRGSHLDMQLLPDYLVYSREKVLNWGFWNSDRI